MKVLFVRYKKTKDIFEGGERGSQKNHDVIAGIVGKENVTTYYIHDENRKNNVWDYAKGTLLFPFHYFFGLTPFRVKEIVTLAFGYDVVFIDRSVFGIIAKKLKKQKYPGRIITFFHNVEVPYFEAKLGKRPGRGIVLRCADHNDRYSCQYSDKIIVLNKRDDAEIFARYNRHGDVITPVVLPDHYNKDTYPTETTGQPLHCLFLGAYFTPNNEGILWFVNNVMPHVNVKLRIVGKNMAKLKAEEPALRDIEVISDAPNLEPFFEEADVMILPIFKGSGMKIKTCESMMYGKNILGTDETFEGYEINDYLIGGRCNTAEEYIACIKDFELNPRSRFNQYARKLFLERYSEASVVESFRKVLMD